jgi:RNA polymerase primary sigma factor
MSCTATKHGSVSDSLSLYLREIKDESLLSAEEECTLAEAISHGDDQARSRMIRANLRLVVKIARDYVGRGLVLEDLIGEGNLGLIRASEEFEPRFGTRFSTYASYWIKQAIRHALINTTSTIRLPAHMVGLLTRWRRAERAIYREQGRTPSFGEVAQVLGLSETQRSLVAKACQARQLKLQNRLAAGGSRWPPDESSDDYQRPEAVLEADEERRALWRRMERLDPRERAILALRYGLEGELPLTLKEIGRRMGVTREWVRKIELRAMRKLDEDRTDLPARGVHERRAAPTRPSATAATRGQASAPASLLRATEVLPPRKRYFPRCPTRQGGQPGQVTSTMV